MIIIIINHCCVSFLVHDLMPSLKICAIIFHKQKLSSTMPEKGNEHKTATKVQNPLAGSEKTARWYALKMEKW